MRQPCFHASRTTPPGRDATTTRRRPQGEQELSPQEGKATSGRGPQQGLQGGSPRQSMVPSMSWPPPMTRGFPRSCSTPRPYGHRSDQRGASQLRGTEVLSKAGTPADGASRHRSTRPPQPRRPHDRSHGLAPTAAVRRRADVVHTVRGRRPGIHPPGASHPPPASSPATATRDTATATKQPPENKSASVASSRPDPAEIDDQQPLERRIRRLQDGCSEPERAQGRHPGPMRGSRIEQPSPPEPPPAPDPAGGAASGTTDGSRRVQSRGRAPPQKGDRWRPERGPACVGG